MRTTPPKRHREGSQVWGDISVSVPECLNWAEAIKTLTLLLLFSFFCLLLLQFRDLAAVPCE